MKAFLYQIRLQFVLDIRNKQIFLPFYVIPIVFFLVMSAVFNSILIDYEQILIPSMLVFSITMAAVLGMPLSLYEIYGTDIKKMYHLGNIPSFIPGLVCLISTFIHLILLSIVIIVFGIIIYQAVLPINTLWFVVSLISFILASEGIGLLIGVLSKKQSDIAIFGQVVFLPSVILSGAMFSSDLLPKAFQYVSYILPASLGMKSMIDTTKYIWMLPVMLLVLIISVTISYFKVRKIVE